MRLRALIARSVSGVAGLAARATTTLRPTTGATASLLLALATTLTVGCGGEESSKVAEVTTLCSDGEQRCYGNALLTCEASGKAWKVASCGASKTCVKDGAGATCKAVVCAKASLTCDDSKVLKCPDDGLTEATPFASCKPTEHCTFGTCVPTSCTSGDKRCGWNAALSCEGGAWKSQKCANGERCDDTSHTCVAQACVPTAIACVSETKRQTCKVDGSGWVEAACAAGEVCNDGVCHAKVKGSGSGSDASGSDATAADASGEDSGGFLDVQKDEFVFEPLDVLTIYKAAAAPIPAGTKAFEYEFNSANYLSVEQLVQITGNANLEKIEISVAPVEEFTTGSTNETEQQWPTSAVKMNDGTNDSSAVQFRYEAIEYTINIDEFGDVGGRIKGSFKALMADAIEKGKSMYVEGTFDIKRTQ